jgi:hypothetical protein
MKKTLLGLVMVIAGCNPPSRWSYNPIPVPPVPKATPSPVVQPTPTPVVAPSPTPTVQPSPTPSTEPTPEPTPERECLLKSDDEGKTIEFRPDKASEEDMKNLKEYMKRGYDVLCTRKTETKED